VRQVSPVFLRAVRDGIVFVGQFIFPGGNTLWSTTARAVELRTVEGELFVIVDGMTIAKRGKPGSPHAGRWIAIGLAPFSWTVESLGSGYLV
jgi:hypothetical protein